MKIINLTRLLEPTRLRLRLMSGSAWPVSVQTIGNGKNTASTDGNKSLSCINLIKKEGKAHYPAPMASYPIDKKTICKKLVA
jgi:hypothetical protein